MMTKAERERLERLEKLEQDDLLYPLTPRQMTMNSTFEIAIDVVERIRKEQSDDAQS